MKSKYSDDDMFMEVARTNAKRSHCLRKKVGAVLVRKNFQIASGRNGTLPGLPNVCENEENGELITSDFVLHAEQNVLLFCAREGISTRGTTMYITLAPCVMCAKLVAGAGITEVVYEETYRDTAGIDFLKKAGVYVRQYKGTK